MSSQKVTKCICHDQSFETIKEYAREKNLSTIDGLQKHDFCSNGCQLCSPYVEALLETGQTEFLPGEPFGK
ncbi:BFD-like [2Fe-2S] binding domain-containing protein [Fodinibius salinus]|uniref:BFD-like [2Fe-2S] binding domain-containing protein n=1 Tax=Fodinibius salinus TaxID=860790 RepID=A0A5D3YL13_9BACT|nr:(2Fe-2S)-binding protein [Fodinibius salinus]TYP94835.1 BFD-like [2Fe-2S] binding domain-containing protein [Fodinibius salinus]